jgi:hypothetical protein
LGSPWPRKFGKAELNLSGIDQAKFGDASFIIFDHANCVQLA